MNNSINCVYEIKNDYFNIVSNYFDSMTTDELSQIHKTNNYLIYKNKNYWTNNKESVVPLNKLPFLFNNKIVGDFENCVQFLKSEFEIGRMWTMSYIPKSYLTFHRDYGLKRHVISFNHNELFFNYESSSPNSEFRINFYTENIKELINEPEKFNDLFLNDDKNNKIIVLEKNKIYCFGNCVHSFFNASTDKHRFNIVFEVID